MENLDLQEPLVFLDHVVQLDHLDPEEKLDFQVNLEPLDPVDHRDHEDLVDLLESGENQEPLAPLEHWVSLAGKDLAEREDQLDPLEKQERMDLVAASADRDPRDHRYLLPVFISQSLYWWGLQRKPPQLD